MIRQQHVDNSTVSTASAKLNVSTWGHSADEGSIKLTSRSESAVALPIARQPPRTVATTPGVRMILGEVVHPNGRVGSDGNLRYEHPEFVRSTLDISARQPGCAAENRATVGSRRARANHGRLEPE